MLFTTDADAAARRQIVTPQRLHIMWTDVSLTATVAVDAERPRLEFSPPWPRTSPLPPRVDERTRRLTVTARPMPDDAAFVVPLGAGLADRRETVSIVDNVFPDGMKARKDDSPLTRAGTTEVATRGETSMVPLRLGSLVLELKTVKDLPKPSVLLASGALALALFGCGLWVTVPRLRTMDRWIIGGLAATSWSLLLLRFVLAFRYALDPAHLDAHAVKAVTSALVALTLIPPAVLLAAVFWRDQRSLVDDRHRARVGRLLFWYVVALGLAAWGQAWLARSLWLNAPETGGVWSMVFSFATGVVVVALLATLGHIFFRYWWDAIRGVASPRALRVLAAVRWAFVAPADLPHGLATRHATRLWRLVGDTTDEEFAKLPRREWVHTLIAIGAALGVMIVGLGLIAWTVAAGSTSTKWVQEIIGPILLCWLPALVWLGLRKRFYPGSRVRVFRWGRAVGFAGILMAVPVFFVPFALKDPGGIVASLAVFVPVTAVLLIGRRPWRLPCLASGLLLVAFVLGWVVYLSFENVLPVAGRFGHTATRVLIFKHGLDLQSSQLWSPMRDDDEARYRPTFRSLAQALEHTWENRAIVHEGGWLGFGYGKAPVRQSQVPQVTLQADSTFSFFVVAEHGVAGGLILIALYAVPLALVLVSARTRVDLGHAVAIVVSAALFLEASAHSLMNLGVLPFTGRNLPLLAAGSNSDAVRWALFLAVMAQALMWRMTGADEGFIEPSILSSPADIANEDTEPACRYRVAVIALIALPIVALALAAYAGAIVLNDKDVGNSFDSSRLLDRVRYLGRERDLHVDAELKVHVKGERLGSGSTFLEQEIARFNAMPRAERVGMTSGSVPADFVDRLRGIRSRDEYDTLMRDLRLADAARPERGHPSLFLLVPPARWADDAGTIPTEGASWTVTANPAFNTWTTFRTAERGAVPVVSLGDGPTSVWTVAGQQFEILFAARGAKGGATRRVVLEPRGDGTLRVAQDTNPDAAVAEVLLRHRASGKPAVVGTYTADADGLKFKRGELKLQLRRVGKRPEALKTDAPVLRAGDVVESSERISRGIRLSFTVNSSARGALVGPAWVSGRWRMVYDHRVPIPWSPFLAAALVDESRRYEEKRSREVFGRLERLSLDGELQRAAQRFAQARGRALHAELIAQYRAHLQARGRPAPDGSIPLEVLPPRVALTVMRVPQGGVLALGGWPHVTSDRYWHSEPDGELLPPVAWIAHAPGVLRARYAGDRNFDRLVLGSAAKPIIAAAALAAHPGLDRRLAVTGGGGTESEAFGIPFRVPWLIHSPSRSLAGGAWCDFRSYLARSDNRYQVRLGLLALAERDPSVPSGIRGDPGSRSTLESLDGGATPWRRFPQFPRQLQFAHDSSDRITGLQQTPLAERLRSMFSIGVTSGDVRRRVSFWSGDEEDDWKPTARRGSFREFPVSPEAPDLELDTITHPRQYVNILLGGGTNRWANVDFAAAFATALTGQPIIAHVTRPADAPRPHANREPFREIAARLRPGLRAAVEQAGGTANSVFAQHGALAVLGRLPGFQSYAKTGTLAVPIQRAPRTPAVAPNRPAAAPSAPVVQTLDDVPDNSRVVLAVVRWDGDSAGASARPLSGLVFSLVAERAGLKRSTAWLADFVVDHEPLIRRALGLRD